MGILKSLNIANSDSPSTQIFEDMAGDFYRISYNKPSEYITHLLEAYKKQQTLQKLDASTNGRVFEYILATLFIREGLVPFYMGAKVAFVPNVEYDFILYTTERGPYCISAKTSLRERYKQADLEAIALKYVHRRACCALVTNDEKEALATARKIKTGDVIGLDSIIYSRSAEFDALIADLKKYTFCKPEKIEVVKSSRFVSGNVVE